MRKISALIAGLIAIGVAGVIAIAAPDLHLRGNRFRPLTYDQLTAEQKVMVDHILSGPRGSMSGPFNVLLRSPEMGDLAQALGAYMRFKSSIPHKLNELAILMTGRFWNAQYEWYAHHKIALEAGLSPAIIDAIAAGNRPTGMQPDEAAVYDFCHEFLETKQVSDATYKATVDKFGERGVVDLVGVVGCYHLVSMLLNVDRYPMPDGVKPEL